MEPREDQLLGQFIPLHYHGQMLADKARMRAFRAAIALIATDAHVVELGGGTGVLSFFASQRARKVRCVERLAESAAYARRTLRDNGASSVEVVEADAFDYLPDEPVDVLICEMLHTALLREKQVQVVATFRARHLARFGVDVPHVIPEASVLSVQPVFQPYDFAGYHAPVPLFLVRGGAHDTVELARPVVYATLDYALQFSTRLACDQVFTIDAPGMLNALRFSTQNVVGVFPDDPAKSADWHMHQLVLPLATPRAVQRGDRVRVRFAYEAGTPIEALVQQLELADA